jgi:hypothetical protein
LLVALLPGGIDPVQVTVTVCPMVEGTVTLLVGGVAASTTSKAATEKRLKATKTRRLKRPAVEVGSFRMMISHLLVGQVWI